MIARTRIRPLVLSAAVLGLTGAAWAFGPGGRADSPQSRPPAAPQAAASAAAPLFEPLAPDEEKRFTDAWAQQPRVDLGIAAGTAKVVVVKFNDWLCPGCKGMHEAYLPLLDKYEREMPGAVKYVVKDWPWNSHCNFSVPQTFAGHESSCEAAVAVRLAREHGKEREMVTWLFNEQEKLISLRGETGAAAARIVAQTTTLLRLKPGDFEREYPLRVQAVRQDVSDGIALHMEVTPTYYVNGVKTTAPVTPDGKGGDNLPPNYFDLAVRLELKKAAGK